MIHRRKAAKPALTLSAAALRGIERRGIAKYGLRDLYHVMMTVPLSALLAWLAGAFILVNVIFAGIYFAIGGLAGVRAGQFAGAFFFSAQTLSTTGYGAIYPVSLAANLISNVEILIGLLGTALATGMLFARLSRPQARVLFSNVALVNTYQQTPTFMFRLANERRNQIAEARISVTVVRDEVDDDGRVLRRMLPLQLERDVSPVFALSWLVMHKITADSPFHGFDATSLAKAGIVIICALSGIDDTLKATIYTRHIYGAEDVLFGQRFVDVIEFSENRALAIDYGRFHDTIAATE